MKTVWKIVGAVALLAVVVACGDKPAPANTQPAESRTEAYKYQGTLLVGYDIAPGTYRGVATDYCYVERTAANGDIIENNIYESGDVVLLVVKKDDYSVKVDKGCALVLLER